ncbi:MAG: RIP metalloprotease RseP [Candidatus Parcubacteria bacterium]|nr:RIP metalloprotease RseP [Candidatus Parcubacteria bacterium]
MLTTVLIFLIVLGILVLVHELGHFLTAKLMGMKIYEFAIGFPPKIWSKKGKDGVIYSINAIPLGGFVNLRETESEASDPNSFVNKKPWKRAVVILAGVAMNFLLCVVLLSFGFMFGLPQSVDQDALNSGQVTDYKIQVVTVLDDKPAKTAGVEIGDVLLAVDDQNIKSVKDLVAYTGTKIGDTVNFKFLHNKQEVTKPIEIAELENGKGGIGVGLVETGIVSYPVHLAVWHGIKLTLALTKEFVLAFVNIFKNLIIGQPLGVQVSGPVGIAVLTGQVAKLGIIYLLQFTALLSLNLAIINAIPFPAFDGGHILFIIIEKIRRKPVDKKIEGIIHTIGFSLLMLLIIVITFQDILRYSHFFSNFFSNLI